MFCPPPPHCQGSPPAPCSSCQEPGTVSQPRTEDRDAIQTQHPLQRPPPPPQASCWQLPLSTRQRAFPGVDQAQVLTAPAPGRPCWHLPSPSSSKCRPGGGGSALLLMELPPEKARGTSRPVGPSRAQGGGCGGHTAAPFFTPASDRGTGPLESVPERQVLTAPAPALSPLAFPGDCPPTGARRLLSVWTGPAGPVG